MVVVVVCTLPSALVVVTGGVMGTVGFCCATVKGPKAVAATTPISLARTLGNKERGSIDLEITLVSTSFVTRR
ncbi:MAG: hypothetical protein M3Y41_10020 [Pseudomonadota bacterium]|nr:hypothetical protein [Pseudomonadota bacterium]